jgi:hypothetical protein
MSAILPSTAIDSDAKLARHFMPHQLHWIQGEDAIHAQKKQAYALAEKSVRIGWTYADGFKNVRKRLRFKKRNYLFATKDWPSALEYMKQVYEFAELFNLTGSIAHTNGLTGPAAPGQSVVVLLHGYGCVRRARFSAGTLQNPGRPLRIRLEKAGSLSAALARSLIKLRVLSSLKGRPW